VTTTNLPPVPAGATVYTHPQQGKTIYVLADGTMQVYKADGKRATSSATPAKLAAGYGAWERMDGGSTAYVAPVAPATPTPVSLYIAPQLAQEAVLSSLTHYIVDDDKVEEQKLDGHRVLLVSPGGDAEPIALTRNGQPYTRGLPRKIREWRFPEGNGYGEMILDGELVGDTYWVFDMPKSAGNDESSPLSVRRFMLEQVLEFLTRGCDAIRLVPQAKTTEEKRALAAKAIANNFEGLIVKDKRAPYRMGARTEEWLKFKFVTTADCFVMAVRDDGKESIKLGMAQPFGNSGQYEIVEVGRASLIGKEKRGEIAVGDVVEVRYLYCGAGGRLYQPTILRKRTDKPMHECTTRPDEAR
jgi:bifunctional non-homologous end joining protein LigD